MLKNCYSIPIETGIDTNSAHSNMVTFQKSGVDAGHMTFSADR